MITRPALRPASSTAKLLKAAFAPRRRKFRKKICALSMKITRFIILNHLPTRFSLSEVYASFEPHHEARDLWLFANPVLIVAINDAAFTFLSACIYRKRKTICGRARAGSTARRRIHSARRVSPVHRPTPAAFARKRRSLLRFACDDNSRNVVISLRIS